MSRYRPFIDDLEYRARLEGERYVVLRPGEAVSDVHRQVRTVVRERLSGLPVSYPARAHVTLTGFPSGTSLDAIRDLVSGWAPTVPFLLLEVERVGFFPAPTQAVIVQIRKTPELFDALATLRGRVRESELPDWPQVAVEDWTFHMSVAYCSSLSAAAWNEVTSFVAALDVQAGQCVVDEVEVVAFDDGREYSGGVYVLSASGKEERPA